MNVRILAIAGGSCSGKTRLANYTQKALGDEVCTIIRQDNFYKDLGGAAEDAPLPNFDHPKAFEWEGLRDALSALKTGQAVDIPVYDFVTHRRKVETEWIDPKPLMLIEGILLLSQQILLPIFDQSFFIECSQDVRYERRLARDIAERGRTEESVHKQLSEQVTPMHIAYVEPSKKNADMIITQNQCSLEMITHNGPLIAFCKGMLTADSVPIPDISTGD